MRDPHVDYGLDAPGVFRWLLFGGLAAAIVGFSLNSWASHRQSHAILNIVVALQNIGIGCLTGAALMFGSSRYGKFRLRDRLLNQLNLRGDETVLDVGCGHGLLLIGAAKRLLYGRAVGIDLWSQADQANNSSVATRRNTDLEGVADRVEIHDADMRKLPFPSSSFDAVVAHFAIHNISQRAGRREAIREIVRVLKAGGKVALSDMKSAGLYADELRKSGMAEVKVSWPIFWTWPPTRIVTAHKPPATE